MLDPAHTRRQAHNTAHPAPRAYPRSFFSRGASSPHTHTRRRVRPSVWLGCSRLGGVGSAAGSPPSRAAASSAGLVPYGELRSAAGMRFRLACSVGDSILFSSEDLCGAGEIKSDGATEHDAERPDAGLGLGDTCQDGPKIRHTENLYLL
ncbi:hypothetical protein BS78_08G093700 [Paspalum vaginatum]|nr:hypothetical protein BS78_08G093700 [Paspalum vaginatum]